MNLPRSRNNAIVETNLGKEILVYDLITHKAFNLNKTSAIVYQACGDGLTFDELKRRHNFSDDLIYLALDELRNNNLLVGEDYVSPFAGMNRREVIRKVGLASMIALPLVVGLIAPKAIDAQSACRTAGQTCNDAGNFSQNNCCTSNLRCFGTSCNDCRPTNGAYIDCPNVSGGCTISNCNANIRKNLCCNTGNATTDGTFCYCP